jgi:hypothetical protein
MGFALGGSVFWGLYGPNTAIPHASQLAEQHAGVHESRSKKEETDEALAYYTLWLMLFTGVLAFATIGLGVATFGLYLTGEKQIELNARVASAQSRDMMSSVNAANRSAVAAGVAAELSERSMIAANRPWVKVDIGVAGPVHYNVNGANITLRYTVTNIGRSPALNVMVSPQVVLPIISADKPGSFDPRGTLQKSLAEHATRAPGPFGYSLFPGDAIEQTVTVTISQDEIKAATTVIAAIYPTIIGFAEYRMVFDNKPHRTAFMVEVRRSNIPRPSTIAKNRAPDVIWIDEGDVPAEHVSLFRSFIDGGYAD